MRNGGEHAELRPEPRGYHPPGRSPAQHRDRHPHQGGGHGLIQVRCDGTHAMNARGSPAQAAPLSAEVTTARQCAGPCAMFSSTTAPPCVARSKGDDAGFSFSREASTRRARKSADLFAEARKATRTSASARRPSRFGGTLERRVADRNLPDRVINHRRCAPANPRSVEPACARRGADLRAGYGRGRSAAPSRDQTRRSRSPVGGSLAVGLLRLFLQWCASPVEKRERPTIR